MESNKRKTIIFVIKGYLKNTTLFSDDGNQYTIYWRPNIPKEGYYKLRQITDNMYYVIKFVQS